MREILKKSNRILLNQLESPNQSLSSLSRPLSHYLNSIPFPLSHHLNSLQYPRNPHPSDLESHHQKRTRIPTKSGILRQRRIVGVPNEGGKKKRTRNRMRMRSVKLQSLSLNNGIDRRNQSNGRARARMKSVKMQTHNLMCLGRKVNES